MTDFRIKVCGVRSIADLDACVEAGVDAVGLNGYPPSVRYVRPESDDAVDLAAAAAERNLQIIGVFVNVHPERLQKVAEQLRLDAIQLHGNEPIAAAEQLIASGVRVVRAVRLPRGVLKVEQIETEVRPWADLGCRILIDADAGTAYGGEGLRLHWPSLRAWCEATARDWILAGGLTPANLDQAIRQSGAHRLDVASGVEHPKGVKRADLIHSFVVAANRAWASDPD